MFLIFREIHGEYPGTFQFTPEEYRHVRARRLLPGAAVVVGDGRGRRQCYRLNDSGDAITCTAPESDIIIGAEPAVELCTAIPEGRRLDWLLQKATELGATVIQPIVCAHSESRRLKRDREERIILEAAIQSRRFVLPVLGDSLSLSQALKGKNDAPAMSGVQPGSARALEKKTPLCAALDPRGDRSFANFLKQSEGFPGALQFFVGPEGGFSEQELLDFAEAGVVVCRLGTTILRVETAALAALACFASRED